MRLKTINELDSHLSGDVENLTFVEVLGNANHGVGDQRTLRICGSKGNVCLQGVIKTFRFLVSLG